MDGFGGASDNVTLFGESGGAMSICAQMLFPAPASGRLFRRAILMSGVLGPGTAPGTREEADVVYEMFLRKLGIEERGERGLEEMRKVDLDRIVRATEDFTNDGLLLRTVRTEEWLGEGFEDLSWDRIPEAIGRNEWVEEIVLGLTSFEVCFLTSREQFAVLTYICLGHDIHVSSRWHLPQRMDLKPGDSTRARKCRLTM